MKNIADISVEAPRTVYCPSGHALDDHNPRCHECGRLADQASPGVREVPEHGRRSRTPRSAHFDDGKAIRSAALRRPLTFIELAVFGTIVVLSSSFIFLGLAIWAFGPTLLIGD